LNAAFRDGTGGIPRQSGRPADPVAPQARFARHTGKRSAAVIAAQNIAAPAGDEDAFESVVVVVGDGHARSLASAHQSGVPGHIRERAVAVVPIESVGGALDTGRFTTWRRILVTLPFAVTLFYLAFRVDHQGNLRKRLHFKIEFVCHLGHGSPTMTLSAASIWRLCGVAGPAMPATEAERDA
jgi:hypothetical protein